MKVNVCYVQNYLGIMDGEDVISSLLVTTNQDRVDNWLSERLWEGKELGFQPEELPDSFFGITDYELVMSKGNEQEGYTSYGLVCRTCMVEE
ncbi:hypothetical protein [Ructibacterium gallinarum]|uniref:Uncharacterized protein n=1 Tax=Ructibacterium gallinarum TaxID=2779355 RepID=A0A9D5LYU8_9FIRM|nr:hypothetical protein [Ructibacterium gallinarum]MBE5040531.1 hypothetical protein [Ructibacterium gallinarum]